MEVEGKSRQPTNLKGWIVGPTLSIARRENEMRMRWSASELAANEIKPAPALECV